MLGNVVGTAVPAAPVTLAQGEGCTPGVAVDCTRDQVVVCTLDPAAGSMPALAVECMLGPEEDSTLAQEVDSMPALAGESILGLPPMMATKVHGGRASPEPRAANGRDKTALNDASSYLFECALTTKVRSCLPRSEPFVGQAGP